MTTLVIERLGHLGDGIAPGPVFVSGALPGEEVAGEVQDGVIAEPKIVTPSPDRVSPPCPHARRCGGCQLQHASEDFVAHWKVGVVRQALLAQGIEAEFRPILTSPPQSRRRAAFSVRRTKKGALAGFHVKRSDVIVPIPNCRVVHPDLAAALPLVEALAVFGGSRKGELSVLVTRTESGLDVTVSGGKPIDAPARAELAELARSHDLARIAWGVDETLERRPPILTFGRARVTPPPGALLQATPEGQTALTDAVLGIVGDAKRGVDLFAGCGTFALPLCERAAMHAVEGDPAMSDAADHAWRHTQGLRQLTTETRDLFRNPLMAAELAPFDFAVIDPPRAGADAQIREIAEAHVPRVAHVSCNPVTFARDAAALLRAGYRLEWVQVVDQFRWSTHIELVAAFRLDKTS